jgi:hypothetical protein
MCKARGRRARLRGSGKKVDFKNYVVVPVEAVLVL